MHSNGKRLNLINVTLSSTFNSLNSGICLKNVNNLINGTEWLLSFCKKVIECSEGFHGRPSRAEKWIEQFEQILPLLSLTEFNSILIEKLNRFNTL